MRQFLIEEIKTWERFYRANFINCLTGFKPVSLVGSISNAGVPNLSVVSSIVHLGADPALIGYINRPIAAAPDTITNIEHTKCYTINHINETFLQNLLSIPYTVIEVQITDARHRIDISIYT